MRIHREKWDIWVDPDGIVRIQIRGDQNENDARAYVADVVSIVSTLPPPILLLADASGTGRISPAARQVYSSAPETARGGRYALVGLKPLHRVVARIVFRFRGVSGDRYRVFDDLGEARAWLLATPKEP
ncbi:MAG: STAS/SEC14 domain-containing protein [Methanobacteriota archaeon]